MKSETQHTYLGKYREIVLAVACFLVFDLAVLVLNFYISFQIAESAVEINLAGRQRMLTQRMTKELLTAAQDHQQQNSIAPTLEELKKTVVLFNTTLNGFQNGGMVTGGDGKTIHINAMQTRTGRDILGEAAMIWQPFQALLSALNTDDATGTRLQAAALYARDHNLQLLKLMNRLTTDLEQSANRRADTLRWVQTGGIVLALLNFAFILFKFLRRLRENDLRVERAQEETTEILGTVREGLFLLNQDFRIGSQYSASLATMLGRPIQPGADFRDILGTMVPPAICKSACEYIALLLGDRVKELLVQDLNPLTHVEVIVPDAQGIPQRRYLTLQFNRARLDGRISHLLVTVFDVTAQVELEQALTEARKKAKAEIEVMLDLLKVNPATLRHFLDHAEKDLLEINDHLRHADSSRDYRRTLALIFRQVHCLKGEAAALGLEMFEDFAQQFESQLSLLRNKGEVSGDDLLALPLPLDEFLQRITSVRDLSQRLASYQDSFPAEQDDAALLRGMASLAERIARDSGKQVRLTAELDLMQQMPAGIRNGLNDIALQLLRNAVVHGIEPLTERSLRQKPPVGNIHASLKRIDDEYEFVLHDDGRGIAPTRIRASLLQRGLYTAAQLNELDDRQIIMKIFEPGFSTADDVSRDAGHGVGMDIVKQKVLELGARLRIGTRPYAYTRFCIRFAL